MAFPLLAGLLTASGLVAWPAAATSGTRELGLAASLVAALVVATRLRSTTEVLVFALVSALALLACGARDRQSISRRP